MIVAVSDTHLGTAHLDGADPDRDAFKRFLRYLRDDLRPTHVVFNGDIEDFWRRDMRTLTREDYDVFDLAAELRRAGIGTHYVLGNHDWYARRDVAVADGASDGRYYDTDYAERLRLATDGTAYTFMHGHQFDPLQDEWYFDTLALISTDAVGASLSTLWAIVSRADGVLDAPGIVRKLASDRLRRGSWAERTAEMDRCRNPYDAGDAPFPGEYVAEHPDTDWLCVGHTHRATIREGANVANSGAWLDGRNTYLVLEERPRLMDWNGGDPTVMDG